MKRINIDLEDLESYLVQNSCDHTFRHTFQWAKDHKYSKEAIEELINELEVTCDCDLATLIPDVGDSFEVQIEEESPLITNKWLIPPDYTPLSPDKLYHQVIQSSNSSETDIRNYTNRDEVLIPAPFGYKSKLKIRKSWHFFVGTDSGNPSEIGRVTACSPQSARHFLEMVKQRALPGFEDFDLTVSSFYLESVEKLKLGYGAGVSFIDEQTDTGILKRIRISRKIL